MFILSKTVSIVIAYKVLEQLLSVKYAIYLCFARVNFCRMTTQTNDHAINANVHDYSHIKVEHYKSMKVSCSGLSFLSLSSSHITYMYASSRDLIAFMRI